MMTMDNDKALNLFVMLTGVGQYRADMGLLPTRKAKVTKKGTYYLAQCTKTLGIAEDVENGDHKVCWFIEKGYAKVEEVENGLAFVKFTEEGFKWASECIGTEIRAPKSGK